MKNLIYFLFLFSNLYFGQKQSNEDMKAAADSLYKVHEYDKSLSIYEKLLEKDSKNYFLLGRVGLCFFSLENYQKAKEKFRLAALYCPIEENETIAGYYTNLSSCYSNLNDKEKVYQYAHKAYNLDNKSPEILWNLVVSASKLGKYEECIRTLDNSVIEKSNAFFAIYGESYLSIGEDLKAIDSYENLLKNYDKKNDIIEVNVEYHRSNLFNAYLNVLFSEKSSDAFNKYKNRFIELFNQISQNSENRNLILSNLLNYRMFCYKNKFTTELFKTIFDKLTVTQKIQVYYLDNDNEKCFELANNFLKTKQNVDEKTLFSIKSCHYLAFLNLFIEDIISHDGKVNKEKLETIISIYNNLFEKNKIYTDKEFEDQEGLFNILVATIDNFNKKFPRAEHNKMAPILFKIISATPNEKYRLQYEKLKNKNSIINYQ